MEGRVKYTTRSTQTTQIVQIATMSCVHGFREGKIDGKSFLIFTPLLNQPDNPSSSSSSSSSETTTVPAGGNNDLHRPLFICPNLRLKATILKLKQNGYDSDAINASVYIPMSTSPEFPTKDQQVQYLLDSDGDIDSDSETEVCRQPVVPLSWCDSQEIVRSEYECPVCETSYDSGTNHYFCVSCYKTFHKECVESPSEIKHPSYPFLSFQLSYSKTVRKWECSCCRTPVYGDSKTVCYHCPTSKLNMHPVCALKPIPLEIDHPKRHPHPLTFFPKQAYLPCNVCGLIKDSIPTYLCVPCVSVVHQFVVHQDCAYSPTVIKISRHCHHRISFTTSLPSGEWSCGVCRKAVDNNYGAYSCNRCHGYFVHTRCALRTDLWDGEELEGKPEEDEIVVEPFKTLPDGKIRHFSHDHLLKLEVNRVYDEDKFCSACVLPIIFEDEFYSCMDQCDFILHKACANAPCRKHHPLHAHPLTLNVVTNQYQFRYNNQGYFVCDACKRISCGFVYESKQGVLPFRLDLRCALVSEPFEYQGHDHPLFFALTLEEEVVAVCQICQYKFVRKLNCIECDFVICFTCATLPYKARYKHDKHLLTFRKEKETSDESGWCELCEYKLVYSQSGGFYLCDDCCTTLHVDCLLGKSPYMRHGQTIKFDGKEIHILRNNTMSRPFCHFQSCKERRCPYGVFFKTENTTFCSFSRCTDAG